MTHSRSKILVSALALAALAAVALSPQLLGAHVASAFESLRGAEWHWLVLAAIGFVAAFACTVGAWRAFLPEALVLPHPSWRNTAWLRKNPWFETEIAPYLSQRVSLLLTA